MKPPPPDEKATPAVAFCFALNHVLEAAPWARARLVPFAGRVLELRAPALPDLRLAITDEGTLRAGGEAPSSLVVTLGPELLAALARGEEHVLRAAEVSGDPRLAAELAHLARHLRWDFEEDLARLFGDVAARRLAEAARALAAWHLDAAKRLAAAFADYAGEETRLLVRRAELAELGAEIATMRDAIERLDKRVRRLG